MKKLLIIILLGFSLGLSAQRTHVIVLNNGSEIRGTIQATDENQTSILMKDGSVMVYSSNEIASIEKYVPKVSSTGVFMRAGLGMLGGEQLSPSFLLTNGYSFSPHWDAGLSLGFEFFQNRGFMPILANARFNLLKNHYTPFVDVVAGYEMPLRNFDSNKGGFSSGARLGFTKYLGNKVGFSTSVGYRFAQTIEKSPWWDDFKTVRQFNRYEIRLEFTFK